MNTPLPDRRPNPIPEIAAAPHRYEFFQALRLIDAYHQDQPLLGTAKRPVDEAVRLGQNTSLAFAPSSLHALELQDRSGRPRLEVNFFGLFGPNGPLPLHLTSYSHERKLHKGDETFARFADLFHHRLLLLFYRAWAQGKPTVNLDRSKDDRFAAFVAALVGMAGEAWQGRDAAPDHARLAHAQVQARQARNADGLSQLLSAYLGMQARIEQFVGRWMPLQAQERTRLQRQSRKGASRRHSTHQLGVSAVLGRAVYDRQHHFRIHIGPLDLPAFEALLPVGSALPALQALVHQYIGLEYGWDLALTLKPEQVPACRLGRNSRLGWTSWLGRPHARAEPAVLRLQPRSSPL